MYQRNRKINGSLKFSFLFFLILISGCAHTDLNDNKPGTHISPFSALLWFYRGPLNHLEAVRHGQCPMYPSCSEYAKKAVSKHGEITGWIMACDRLMRCGRDETGFAPEIYVNSTWKYYDPVERNDFWWYENKSRIF